MGPESGGSVPFAQAVVVNSGIANACTGQAGMDCCRAEAEHTGRLLGIPAEAVLVASTGVIGMAMPVDRLRAGIDKLAAAKERSREAGLAAAQAIMTTDTVSKEIAVEVQIGGQTVTIGGMCKGSGMIHPNMCTMLAFLTTDVCISKEMLQRAVSAAVVDSFNMISVDGDTSTNDTLLVLANGQAGNIEISGEGADYDVFCQALDFITVYLARKMAGDGEGATCLFEAKVVGADTKEHARTLAKSVICSSLSKAAIYGHDCNFDVFCALWATAAPALTRTRWICGSRARRAKQWYTARAIPSPTARRRPPGFYRLPRSRWWRICIWEMPKPRPGAAI